ncbi:DEAD/DEAH box helicase [Alistipes shahii]|uniref:DEAD-box ATP-dependent RNA helicase RhpA n=5 Tax=Pseudomonadati TaxID=3379134 RepID=A0A5B3G9I6_9BACT|nr:DEAD/DEAH box helicase [Alistipes shahii]
MKFQDLRLSEPLLRAIGEKGYTDPTPIQQQAIPPVLEGRDLQGCAQTGTGKTAAFTLPMLQLLAAEPAPKGRRPIRALVLTPTRELAIQIDECCRDYARYTPIRHCVIFGGVNQRPQVDALQKGVDLLVATPGRLLDLIGQGYVTLDTIRFFVLDEADRMLDMGFIHDIRRILPLLPERRQTLFFSATMPESIAALAAKILRNPVMVTVTPPASVVETIAQTVHFAEKAEKSQLLIDLLSASDAQQVLVFSRTKHGADKLAKILNRAGIRSCAIHGNKSQNARVKAMNDFKSGECRVMIATDIAARGIDIDQLPLVINYELPEVAETYVHRIGRTGRAGHEGAAWSFCSEDEFEYLCDIQKLTGLTIPTEGPVPEYALRKAAPARKPAQKAAQRPARTQEPKPARNAGAKSAQRPARDADAGQQPAQRPARNTEQKAARNAAKTPQSAQNPAQPEAGATSRPSRPRRRRGTRPAPGTPIEPAGKTASRPADATRGQAPKQGPGNAAKAAGNKSAATAAPKNAPNPAPAPSAKPSRRRKRRGSGNAAGSAATAIAAPAATAEAPQKKWWKRWL